MALSPIYISLKLVLNVPCEFAMLDAVDILGTRKDNITKNINKWKVDANGNRRNYDGRNREQPEFEHDTHHDLEQLHANGIHAIPVDETNFDIWLNNHEYSFVNFYAPCKLNSFSFTFKFYSILKNIFFSKI